MNANDYLHISATASRSFVRKHLVATLLMFALYVQLIAFAPLQARVKSTKTSEPAREASSASHPLATQTGDTIVVFGPRSFDRTGALTKFSEQFTLPSIAVAPFNVQIVNGAIDGTSRVMTGTVRLNGVVLADSSQINIAVPEINKPAQLGINNTIDGSFFGRPGSHLIITITATRSTPGTPPAISDFNPKQGPPGTLVTLTGTSLKPNNDNPTVPFAGSNNSRQPAQVISATSTEVRTTVPNGAQSGFIELTTANGLARTATAFTVQASQDFQLNVTPGTATVMQRSTATQVVAVTSSQPDFSQIARLQVTGLPAGVTRTFDPAQITAGATSTLNLNLANVDLSPGSYSFSVSATATVDGHDVQKTFPATLNVVVAGQTSLTGRVLSTEKDPIIGATVSIDGKTATTDSAGSFLLIGVTA